MGLEGTSANQSNFTNTNYVFERRPIETRENLEDQTNIERLELLYTTENSTRAPALGTGLINTRLPGRGFGAPYQATLQFNTAQNPSLKIVTYAKGEKKGLETAIDAKATQKLFLDAARTAGVTDLGELKNKSLDRYLFTIVKGDDQQSYNVNLEFVTSEIKTNFLSRALFSRMAGKPEAETPVMTRVYTKTETKSTAAASVEGSGDGDAASAQGLGDGDAGSVEGSGHGNAATGILGQGSAADSAQVLDGADADSAQVLDGEIEEKISYAAAATRGSGAASVEGSDDEVAATGILGEGSAADSAQVLDGADAGTGGSGAGSASGSDDEGSAQRLDDEAAASGSNDADSASGSDVEIEESVVPEDFFDQEEGDRLTFNV